MNPLNLAVILLSSVWVSAIYAAEKLELPVMLTPAKAEQIIKERRERGEALEETRREAALNTVALEERVIRREDGQKLVLRRVAAAKKVLPDPVKAIASNENAQGLPIGEIVAEQEMQYETISLGANVYGDQYSEITWRDTETSETFKVWSNVSLNYLSPIMTITDGQMEYGYFGFITNYTQAGEEARQQMAKEHGFEAESRWKYPPVRLASDYYEYFVDAPLDVQVPEKLYRQLDALLAYYLSNKDRLEIEYHNSRMLQAMHEKNLKEHPPIKAKKVIMNYSPLRGEDAK
jgi:hypothetical protein